MRKTASFLALLVVAGAVLWFTSSRQSQPVAAHHPAVLGAPQFPTSSDAAAVENSATTVSTPDSPTPTDQTAPVKATETRVTRASQGPATPGKEPILDEVAREALALVGSDPMAELYWFEAINDPNLSAHERQDLIEDLNEDGLSDPKHPTPDDLPTILNRLQLIELLAPAAMDQVNFDAFQEAYKDLMNLADVAMGSGVPPR